ncbi:MAG: hypothetical protein AAFV43_10275 [Planctomycetota bacterium]
MTRKLFCPVAIAAALVAGSAADASLLNSNPSFEADAVGVLGGPPTEWQYNPQAAGQSAAFEIVTGQGVTDGAQALKIDATVDALVNGFTRAVELPSSGVQPDNGQPLPGMVQGQTYTATGSITPLSADTFYELQIQNSGPFFVTFEQFPVGSFSTAADPSLIGQTQSFSVDFVYGGGPIQYNVNLIDQSQAFTVRTMELIVDDLKVVDVIPEPGSLAVAFIAALSFVGSHGRR